jgi:hypothetical protein
MTGFKWCGVAAITLAVLLGDRIASVTPIASFVTDAHAARVVIRRSTTYVAILPAGCVRTRVGGVVLWRCGTVYYQPYKGSYVVVYIN